MMSPPPPFFPRGVAYTLCACVCRSGFDSRFPEILFFFSPAINNIRKEEEGKASVANQENAFSHMTPWMFFSSFFCRLSHVTVFTYYWGHIRKFAVFSASCPKVTRKLCWLIRAFLKVCHSKKLRWKCFVQCNAKQIATSLDNDFFSKAKVLNGSLGEGWENKLAPLSPLFFFSGNSRVVA